MVRTDVYKRGTVWFQRLAINTSFALFHVKFEIGLSMLFSRITTTRYKKAELQINLCRKKSKIFKFRHDRMWDVL